MRCLAGISLVVILALGGCAALARFPKVCIDQQSKVTQRYAGVADGKAVSLPVKIEQKICVGPERR